MKRFIKDRRRRIDRKSMDRFMKDSCWCRCPPMKLRKIRPLTDEEANFLYELRAIDIEAGRKRKVARGLGQYAKPGELGYEEHKKFEAEQLKKVKEDGFAGFVEKGQEFSL